MAASVRELQPVPCATRVVPGLQTFDATWHPGGRWRMARPLRSNSNAEARVSTRGIRRPTPTARLLAAKKPARAARPVAQQTSPTQTKPAKAVRSVLIEPAAAADSKPRAPRAAAAAAAPKPASKKIVCGACAGKHEPHLCGKGRGGASAPRDSSCEACQGRHVGHSCGRGQPVKKNGNGWAAKTVRAVKAPAKPAAVLVKTVKAEKRPAKPSVRSDAICWSHLLVIPLAPFVFVDSD